MNEDKNNINIGDDPTIPIPDILVNPSMLEEEYNKLSSEEKILVACKMLGMDHKPVPIRKFICDDYFMGDDNLFNHGKALFKPWYDELEKIYPNSITTKYPWISLGGAVGLGKSTISKILALYTYHRLDCCSNVFKSLGIANSKLGMAFFHSSFETAKRDFKNYVDLVFETSPYFRSPYHRPPVRFIPSGPTSGSHVIGVKICS